jgi:hypothetical protein
LWHGLLDATSPSLIYKAKGIAMSMNHVLLKIKRLALQRRLKFTFKAECEMLRSYLSEDDIIEALVNAPAIKKVIASENGRSDKLYVIESPNFDGIWVYTKGKFMKNGREYYVLISSKISE